MQTSPTNKWYALKISKGFDLVQRACGNNSGSSSSFTLADQPSLPQHVLCVNTRPTVPDPIHTDDCVARTAMAASSSNKSSNSDRFKSEQIDLMKGCLCPVHPMNSQCGWQAAVASEEAVLSMLNQSWGAGINGFHE